MRPLPASPAGVAVGRPDDYGWHTEDETPKEQRRRRWKRPLTIVGLLATAAVLVAGSVAVIYTLSPEDGPANFTRVGGPPLWLPGGREVSGIYQGDVDIGPTTFIKLRAAEIGDGSPDGAAHAKVVLVPVEQIELVATELAGRTTEPG